MPDKGSTLFGACRFAFVPSRSLLPKTIAELSRTAQKYGGEILDPAPDGSLKLQEATHIVANSIDFEQYSRAIELMIPVVTSSWVTHSLSRGKMAQIRPFSPDPRMIFATVCLTCADIPQGDKEAITGATLALGGTESKDLGRLTTHICALSMDHPKCQEAVAKKHRCKIVLPHWFDDCFKLGKKIDETPYLLPDPPILRLRGGNDGDDEDGNDAIPIPDNQDLQGAVATFPDTIPNLDKGSSARGNLTVFQNKKVILSSDLGIGKRFRAIVVDMIKRGGGRVIEEEDDESVEACDMFICHYRDGDHYVQAAQHGKDVGNLSWLFHIITRNAWCSPLRRLLHYPIPRRGIAGFEDYVVTLSNYGGEARIYLENLVVAAGGKFTKTMRMDNTHLITARDNSEKCEAARDWNIHMVNHLWIEESYARCEVQSVSNPRYTTFPARTNLGEVIGQTFLDEGKLRALYYPGGEEEGEMEENEEKMDEKENEENGEKTDEKERTTTSKTKKTPLKRKRSVRFDETLSDAPALEDVDDNVLGEPEADTETPVKLPHRSTQRLATPSRTSSAAAASSPLLLSSASRSAKDKALSNLHRLAPDIALYEKEKKRSVRDAQAPWGGKRAADLVEKERAALASARKRSTPDGAGADGDSTDSEDVERPAKKRASLPPVKMRIVLTGYQRWVNSSAKEESDRRKLRQLGIQIVQAGQSCDYLAAPSLVRTMKFLKTLARGPEIINAQFLTDVLEKNKYLSPDDYQLHDTEGEKRFHMSLSKALARARQHRGQLLRQVVIYCVADIKNGVESYREIAEANGAIFKTYRAHSGTTIRPTSAEEDGDAPPEPVYLLTSAAPAERALWPKFEQMARNGHMEPRVVAPDWLLDVAMRQEVVFDEHYLAREFWK